MARTGVQVRTPPDWNYRRLVGGAGVTAAVPSLYQGAVGISNNSKVGHRLAVWGAELEIAYSAGTPTTRINMAVSETWPGKISSATITNGIALYPPNSQLSGQAVEDIEAAGFFFPPGASIIGFAVNNHWKWDSQWPLAVIPTNYYFVAWASGPLDHIGYSFIWEDLARL